MYGTIWKYCLVLIYAMKLGKICEIRHYAFNIPLTFIPHWTLLLPYLFLNLQSVCWRLWQLYERIVNEVCLFVRFIFKQATFLTTAMKGKANTCLSINITACGNHNQKIRFVIMMLFYLLWLNCVTCWLARKQIDKSLSCFLRFSDDIGFLWKETKIHL